MQAIIEVQSLVFLFDKQFGFLVISGTFGWLLQVCVVKSFQYDTPSNIQIVASVGIVFALIGDYFIFGEVVSGTTLIGVAILIGSLVKLTKIKN